MWAWDSKSEKSKKRRQLSPFGLGSRVHSILCFHDCMAHLAILVFHLKICFQKSCKLFPLNMDQEQRLACVSPVCLSPSGCPHWPSRSSPSTTHHSTLHLCLTNSLGSKTSFTESQNGRSWKGPLWVTQSNPPTEAGSPTAGCTGPCPGGS